MELWYVWHTGREGRPLETNAEAGNYALQFVGNPYVWGGTVNHVAMYIGNGQVVHASSRRTGIRKSL